MLFVMALIIVIASSQLWRAWQLNYSTRLYLSLFAGSSLDMVDKVSRLEEAASMLNRIEPDPDSRLDIRLQHIEFLHAQTSGEQYLGWTHLAEAEKQLTAGNFAEARALLQDVPNTGTASTRAMLYLWELDAKDPTDYLEQANDLERQLVTRNPIIPLEVQLNNGITLVGFDVDEFTFALGNSADIVLYLQVPENYDSSPILEFVRNSEWRGYVVGNRIYVAGQVRNLVRNSGFEWPTVGATRFPANYYWEVHTFGQTDLYSLEILHNEDTPTTTACINLKGVSRAGIISTPTTVGPEELLIVGGSIYLMDRFAEPRMALVTHDEEQHRVQRLLKSQGNMQKHLTYADALRANATAVQLQTDLFETHGKACVDNLYVMPLPNELFGH